VPLSCIIVPRNDRHAAMLTLPSPARLVSTLTSVSPHSRPPPEIAARGIVARHPRVAHARDATTSIAASAIAAASVNAKNAIKSAPCSRSHGISC
jgi:hypothetical protein